jgi:FtsP/CotA-like multicopper oxidase with cupredoxin domain
VYIEPKNNPGDYDREVFLTMKEFEPTLSRGGDMAMDFLSPAAEVAALKEKGETAMKASLAKGNPHGYEVGYRSFTINGKMLRHGEPVRVKQGERVLFHVLNGSATEIRSLYLPGHSFTIVATDGNPLPQPVRVPGLWLGTAERISAVVEMNHPGVWVMEIWPTTIGTTEWASWSSMQGTGGRRSGFRRNHSNGTMHTSGRALTRQRSRTRHSRCCLRRRMPQRTASISGRSMVSLIRTLR